MTFPEMAIGNSGEVPRWRSNCPRSQRIEADVPPGGRVGDESVFVQLRNSRTDRLLRNFLYPDFPAGIANENVHHRNHPESWKGADKRHHMAASGARSIVGE